jgi:hypothetical protein
MTTINDILMAPDEATAQERTAALQAILRGQNTMGLIGQLSGDSVLSKVGGSLMGQAQTGEQGLVEAGQHRLAATMKQLAEQRQAQQHAAQLAAQQAEQNRQYGLQQQRLGLDTGRFGYERGRDAQRMELDREKMSQPDIGAIADPVAGGIMMYDKRTGERVMAKDSAGAGPATPSVGKLTDTQAKSFEAAQRLMQTMPIIRGGPPTGSRGRVDAWATGATPNTVASWTPREMASDEGQRYFAAGRNAIAALLRKESGAAIGHEEWAGLGPEYIPMPYDTPQVKQDKLDRLDAQLESLIIQAGPQAGQYLQQKAFELKKRITSGEPLQAASRSASSRSRPVAKKNFRSYIP